MGFYFHASSAGPKAFWNEATGKARILSPAEWSWRRAVESTAGGVPIVLVVVSAAWFDKATALGK